MFTAVYAQIWAGIGCGRPPITTQGEGLCKWLCGLCGASGALEARNENARCPKEAACACIHANYPCLSTAHSPTRPLCQSVCGASVKTSPAQESIQPSVLSHLTSLSSTHPSLFFFLPTHPSILFGITRELFLVTHPLGELCKRIVDGFIPLLYTVYTGTKSIGIICTRTYSSRFPCSPLLILCCSSYRVPLQPLGCTCVHTYTHADYIQTFGVVDRLRATDVSVSPQPGKLSCLSKLSAAPSATNSSTVG